MGHGEAIDSGEMMIIADGDSTAGKKVFLFYNIGCFIRSGRGPPERTLPREFRICCLLVIVVYIVGQDLFHSFDPAVKIGCNSKG
jgi:hypothetical protein